MTKPERLAPVLKIDELRRRTQSIEFVESLAEREASLAAAATRQAINARRRALAASEIKLAPNDYERIANDDLIETLALRLVRRWVTDHRQWDCAHVKPGPGPMCRQCGADLGVPRGPQPLRFLGLLGPVSIGKTVACAWACANIGGHAIKAADVPRILRDYDRDERATRILMCRLLVIDDLGTEPGRDGSPGQYFASALYELIDARLSRRKCLTLVTSNLSRADIVARYEPRTITRIDHDGWFSEKLGTKSLRRAAPAVKP